MEHKDTPNQNRSPQKKRKIQPYFRMSRRNARGRLIWNRRTPLFDKLREEFKSNKSDGVKRSRKKIDGSNDAASSKGKKIMKASDKLMHGSSGQSSGTPLPDKKELLKFLDELMTIDTHAKFQQPVDPDSDPEYYEVIQKPMDLGKIMKKLHRGAYKNLEQLEADVYLISSNALLYEVETTYRVQARKIRNMAIDFFATLKGTLPITTNQQPSPTVAANKRNTNKRTEKTTAAINLDDEFPEHILKADRKAGNNKQFVVDMKRRHTYKKKSSVASPPPLQELQQLVPSVEVDDPLSYARSLARFAADLGPIAWKVASKKIEAALPPGAQYGPGWVSEPPTTHDDQPVPVTPPQPSSKQQAAASDSDSEFPAGYFTNLLMRPLSPESDDGRELAKMGLNPPATELAKMGLNPPATATQTKKKIVPTDRNAAKKLLKKTPSNPGTGAASKLVPSSNPGYYNNAGKPKTMPLRLGAGCYYTAETPSSAKPAAEDHGLSPELIEAVRKLNSQNAASSWKVPIWNKQQPNPTMQGNSLLFQGQNQGSNRVTDMGGFNASFNYSPAVMKQQDWTSKEPVDFSFAGNWGFSVGSSSNQRPVSLQTWENNNNAWGFSAGSSTGGINLRNPNNIPILNQQPAVPQNRANNAWGFAVGSSSAGQAMPNTSFVGNLPMRMAPVNNVSTSSGMPFVDLTGEEEEPKWWLQL